MRDLEELSPASEPFSALTTLKNTLPTSMWSIVSVTSVTGSRTSILLGGLPGKEVIGPNGELGPTGAFYVLAFPGLGYITLLDEGNKGVLCDL